MKAKIGLCIAFLYFAFSFYTPEPAFAQGAKPKEATCRLSATAILSEVTARYRLSPDSERILVAGHVSRPQLILSKKPLSLTQGLAYATGLTPSAGRLVYLLRRSSGSDLRIELEGNLQEIRMGRHPDPMLEKGDVLFVPERCPGSPIKRWQLTDSCMAPAAQPLYFR